MAVRPHLYAYDTTSISIFMYPLQNFQWYFEMTDLPLKGYFIYHLFMLGGGVLEVIYYLRIFFYNDQLPMASVKRLFKVQKLTKPNQKFYIFFK